MTQVFGTVKIEFRRRGVRFLADLTETLWAVASDTSGATAASAWLASARTFRSRSQLTCSKKQPKSTLSPQETRGEASALQKNTRQIIAFEKKKCCKKKKHTSYDILIVVIRNYTPKRFRILDTNYHDDVGDESIGQVKAAFDRSLLP